MLPEILFKPNEVIEIDGKNYRITKKFNRWVQLYNDPESKTFGNATQSAIEAYKLDPKKQYDSATAIGRDNTKKHQDIVQDYVKRRGFGFHQFLNMLMRQAADESKEKHLEWFKLFGKVAGYIPDKPGAVVNVVSNTQNNINIDQSSKEDQADWEAEFESFLMEKGKIPPKQEVNDPIEGEVVEEVQAK